MSYSNGLLSDQSYQTENKYEQRASHAIGFKLTDTGDYDMQNKKLVNVDEGENNQDVVNKHQLDVGLQTKPNKTDVLLLDGTSHMVGDLDLRGNKIILPGEIQMDRKLITNLDTDENQDLSAVNMITLKNNVEPKADKNYVDGEIAKQRIVNNDIFVKKTGDQMTGDLILPHDSFPVAGNTNKAISYETHREIFLSRRESFPMQADINMNNNFIQNIATPTSSHQATNKGYCDYNFLNRQKGGVLMSSLSMNQNDLFEIPAPKYENAAVNKNYVDGEIIKIDTTQFVKKVGDTMTGVLNMNGNKIKNVGTPYTYENDAAVNVGFFNAELNASNSNIFTQITNAYKQYVDGKIYKITTVNTNTNVFKYLNDPNQTSSERNITVNSSSDWTNSPHKYNKRAYDVTLQRHSGADSYDSKIGINLYSAGAEKFTLVFEFHNPTIMSNINITASASTAIIHKQTQQNLINHTKVVIQVDNSSLQTPDYLYYRIIGVATQAAVQAHVIIYGVHGWVDSVDPGVYDDIIHYLDEIFEDDNNFMKIKKDINLDNHLITNLKEGINDNDAVNKLQLDSVSYYANNHTYRSIFDEFYDLVETSRFNINKNAFGVVILGILPNLHLGMNQNLNNYDRVHGLQMNNGYINLKNKVNQSTSFTIFISLYFSSDIKIQFSGDTVSQNGYYPSYSISNNILGIIESSSVTYPTSLTSDLKNKQVMLWICHNASRNLHKFSISNYSSHVQQIINAPMNCETKILRILYSDYVKKIGFVDRFIDIDSLDHHRIMLEEMRNESYFE